MIILFKITFIIFIARLCFSVFFFEWIVWKETMACNIENIFNCYHILILFLLQILLSLLLMNSYKPFQLRFSISNYYLIYSVQCCTASKIKIWGSENLEHSRAFVVLCLVLGHCSATAS